MDISWDVRITLWQQVHRTQWIHGGFTFREKEHLRALLLQMSSLGTCEITRLDEEFVSLLKQNGCFCIHCLSVRTRGFADSLRGSFLNPPKSSGLFAVQSGTTSTMYVPMYNRPGRFGLTVLSGRREEVRLETYEKKVKARSSWGFTAVKNVELWYVTQIKIQNSNFLSLSPLLCSVNLCLTDSDAPPLSFSWRFFLQSAFLMSFIRHHTSHNGTNNTDKKKNGPCLLQRCWYI